MSLNLEKYRRQQYAVRYPRWMAGAPLLYFSCGLASLGDALFGYSQGITSAFLLQPRFLHRMFGTNVTLEEIREGHTGVNPWHLAFMVASLNVTAFFSSLVSAYICDILGRRIAIRIGAMIYLLAAFIQVFAFNLACLIVGRCIQGVGVGILATVVPIFQCEISPGHSRGLFVSLEYFFLNCGFLLASWVGYAFYFDQPSEMAWRGPYAIQAALSLILSLMSFFLPETPRWLIQNDFKTEGLWTLADLQGQGDITNPRVTEVFDEIQDTLAFEEQEGTNARWMDLVRRYPKRTFIAVTSQMFSQLNGINAMLHFLPEVLDRAGFTVQESLLYNGVCAIFFCAGTLPTALYVDRFGRRLFLVTGSIGLVVALAIVGILQFHLDHVSDGERRIGVAHGIFAGAALYLFVFSATWGPIPFLLGAELFPIRARAKGAALADMTSWLFEFIVAFVSPVLFEHIHAEFYFIMVAFCMLSLTIVYCEYPETAHCALEELGEIFGDLPAPRRSRSHGTTVATMSMRGTLEGSGSLRGKLGAILSADRDWPMPRRKSTVVDMHVLPSTLEGSVTNVEGSLQSGASVLSKEGSSASSKKLSLAMTKNKASASGSGSTRSASGRMMLRNASVTMSSRSGSTMDDGV